VIMMPNRHFLTKAIEKIGKVDKQNLEQLVISLRHEEHFLRELLNRIQEGVVIVSPKLEVRFLNRKAQLLTGSSSLLRHHETVGQIIEDNGLRTLIERTIQAGEETYDKPVELFIPRHTYLTVTIQKLQTDHSANQNEWKKFYVVSLIQQSNTDRRESERVQHEKMSSVISLADGIAHEIGNPLNSINIHLQLLLKDIERLPKKEQESIRKTAQIVADETKRLDNIIRNFLKASRRKPVEFQDNDIHDIIRHVLQLLKPEIAANGIEVKTSFDSKIPKFLIDQNRLSQVYLNLIRNSVQAMPKGGKLWISTQIQKKLCMTKIADTGIGIARTDIPKIFDAYYTTKEEGSGLGLMIAYQIIGEHGGKIEVKSKLGEGTVVNVLLPIRTEKLQLMGPKKEVSSRTRE